MYNDDANTDFIGDPQSMFHFSVPLTDLCNQDTIEISIKGHKVKPGSGYTGTLLCTGLTHWKVGELTAKFIGTRSSNFIGKNVLELGCGLGLCGITAAKFVGPHGFVLLTDGDYEVIDIASRNLLLNDVSNQNAKTTLFKWDDEITLQSIINEREERKFDCIIASDCLYGDCIGQAKTMLKAVSKLLFRNHSNNTNNIKQVIDGSIEEKEGNSSGGGWFDNNDNNNNNGSVTSESELSPVFVLGFTRRVQGGESSIEQIFEIADEYGFNWTIAKDSVVDMFGNETSERTLMWEHCIFLFTWK